jgi:hypothetical protein
MGSILRLRVAKPRCLHSFSSIPVRRFHFHLRYGDRVLFDGSGRLLPGLSEAAMEAEKMARSLMLRDERIIADRDEWRLDVREPDDVMLFTLPFSDVRFDPSGTDDLLPPEDLPESEALWSLVVGQTA